MTSPSPRPAAASHPGRSLVVDGVGIRTGGGVTVLSDVLRAAADHPGLRQITLLASAGFESPDLGGRVRVVTRPEVAPRDLDRFYWYRRGLPRALAALSPDGALLLTGGGVAPPGLGSALFLQQSLVFAPEALRRFSRLQQARLAVLRQEMRRAARAATTIVVQTPTMQRWVSGAFGVAASRIRVVLPRAPLAVDGGQAAPERPSGRPKTLEVLYVGHGAPYKNLPCLEEALLDLRARGVPVELLVAGDVPVSKVLPQTGRSLGYLSGARLWEAYRAADVLVLPSLVETVGFPMLEAMRAGTPVVAADRPYAHDVCGEAALYFDPLRPEHLADLLARLFDNPQEGRALANRATALIRARDGADSARALVDYALEAMGPSGGRR